MSVSPRFQIVSLGLCYAAAGVFWGALGVSLPALQANSGLSDAGLGLALGAMALTALPVMRVFGHWLDRIEPWAITGAMLAFALGAALIPVLPGVAGLVVCLAVTGGASGALDIALNNRTARVERDTGARLFNMVHAIFPASMLATSVATGWARDVATPLTVIFGTVTAALIAGALIERRAGGHIEPAPKGSPPGRARPTGALLLLAVIAAAGAFQEAAANAWAAIFVEIVQEGSPFQAGLAAGAFTLGLAIGRLGAHVVEHSFRPMALVQLAALLAALGFGLVSLGVPITFSVTAFFLVGVGVGPIEPAVFRAVATRDDGQGRGPALASVTAIAYLGYLSSPPVLGIVGDAFGFAALWGVSLLIALTVIALAARLTRA